MGKVWLQGWGRVDAEGNFILRPQIKRRYVLFQKLRPCLVDIEAYAPSHYWSRDLQARLATRFD